MAQALASKYKIQKRLESMWEVEKRRSNQEFKISLHFRAKIRRQFCLYETLSWRGPESWRTGCSSAELFVSHSESLHD